jgi:hypothetical protein
MDGARAAVRFLPLAAACAAVAGLHGLAAGPADATAAAHAFGGALAAAFPTFLPAIVYGGAHVALAGLISPSRPLALRLPATLLALGLFLAACLVPVFGGVVLGAGFVADEAARLNGAPARAALLAGIVAAALAYALLLALCERLARLRLRLPGPGAARTGATLLFAALVLALPRLLGHDWGGGDLGGFPREPLHGRELLAIGLMTLGAFLPHAALRFFNARDAERREP